MELLGDVGHLESHFDQFGDSISVVLILARDRCLVCAECIIGLEIIFDAPNGSP
jgi:hypothetical protein